ncbi:CPBP family intramembrane glutamic endopeptidase [Ruminococcus flavefaciens]|uniref:CAAX prenyl protease 2/Lysostaphin resistance protein A-like domain-containing protein n=1 Tax=Ruminococcus flavefaciens 007c TaxID=1341157 RepID=W7V1M1_RUMFL|nr:CPBP family intramembrane glutamic endopeptidase [Ruminococcus flavefaciens]EWM54880.1 hypothetical protein RF007C_11110 [Ruminococcus flavefaciens 007c]
MKNETKKTSLLPTLIIYTIIFYAVWAVFELIVKEPLNNTINNKAVSGFIRDGIIKNLVWTVPAALLVRHFSSELYVGLKEMFSARVSWLKYLPIFAAFTIYILVPAFIRTGRLKINSDFGVPQIIMILFVGLTEEMVFRGWLLNAFAGKERKQLPMLILISVMFMLIHIPIWITQGILVSVFTSLGFIMIIVLGMIFGSVFLKSRNILIPIALHMYWDLLVELFS